MARRTRVDDLFLTNQNWGVAPIGRIQIGDVQSGRTYNIAFDDVVFDSQWIGPDRGALLPIAPIPKLLIGTFGSGSYIGESALGNVGGEPLPSSRHSSLAKQA